MRRLASRRESAFDLVPGHRAIAAVVVRGGILHTLDHRARDLHRRVTKGALDRISAVVARTALDDLDRGAGHQPQYVARLEADVLHPQMTRNVVADLTEPAAEVGAAATRLGPG